VTVSTCMRFIGGFPFPEGIQLSPGRELAAYLSSELRKANITIENQEDVEYGIIINVMVAGQKYELLIFYDGMDEEWWEISYAPAFGLFDRLRGKREDDNLQILSCALDKSIRCLDGTRKIRWYKDPDAEANHAYSETPIITILQNVPCFSKYDRLKRLIYGYFRIFPKIFLGLVGVLLVVSMAGWLKHAGHILTKMVLVSISIWFSCFGWMLLLEAFKVIKQRILWGLFWAIVGVGILYVCCVFVWGILW
jgi:hypothetical protein